MKYAAPALEKFQELLGAAQHVLVLQTEHVDADSLGSALGLEQLLEDQGKKVTLYCYDPVPNYLKHLAGWDRVVNELPAKFDLTILVDGASSNQLEKTFSHHKDKFLAKPLIIIDHHDSTTGRIDFAALELLDPRAGASSQQVVEISDQLGWKLDTESGYALAAGIKADTMNLSTDKTTADTFTAMAHLAEIGVNFAQLRQQSEAAQAITVEHLPLRVKALERVKFFHNNTIALTYFTQAEYESLEDVGVVEKIKNELRILKEVQISVTVTERKGYVNASMRANIPIAKGAAEKFDGGGHDMAASCRFTGGNHQTVIDSLVPELVRLIDEYYAKAP